MEWGGRRRGRSESTRRLADKPLQPPSALPPSIFPRYFPFQFARPMFSSLLLLLLLFPMPAMAFEHIPENDLAKVCRPVHRPIDLLFLLDGSGSVGGSTFQTQMQLLNGLVDVLQIGAEPNQSQLSVMQYATYSFVEFPFSAHRDKTQLRQALQRIRHKSGTTKTGRALDKAFQLFRDKSSGARQGPNVAKVVVVVSDGRSQDDPIPSALRLRQSGVALIALGIGSHVNMAELQQMTADPELAFDNQTLAQSVNRFTDTFRRLSTAELCEFARGGHGADIHCGPDAIEVRTSTSRPFRGRFYAASGRWDDPDCGIMAEGGGGGGNGTELVLRIPLTKCGLERQFSVNPRGHFFRGAALLQFHPNFRTGADKLFPLLCFYRDAGTEAANGMGGGGANGDSEIDWQLVKEHTQRRERPPWGQLPCTYRILADHILMEQMAPRPVGRAVKGGGGGGGTGGGQHAGGGARDCGPAELALGQSVIHSWECDPDQFDVYQSILVHSCFLEPTTNANANADAPQQMLIDERGCSVEPNLLETPQYAGQLKAFARGVAIKGAGNSEAASTLRMRCSLRFCDRLMGECDEMLPPKCGLNIGGERDEQKVTTKEEEEEGGGEVRNEKRRRRRRQTGFPILIRPLNGEGPPPPLVMFSKSSSKRRIPFPVDQSRVFKAGIGSSREQGRAEVTTTTTEAARRAAATVEMTTSSSTGRTTTQGSTGATLGQGGSSSEEMKSSSHMNGDDGQGEEADEEEDPNGEVTGRVDPFQEQEKDAQNGKMGTNGEEITLAPEVLAALAESEIVVHSQELEIREMSDEMAERGAEEGGGTCSGRKRRAAENGHVGR